MPNDATRANAPTLPKDHRFNAFLDRVLEPLPQAVMVDHQHNREIRKGNFGRFILAERQCLYYWHLLKAIDEGHVVDWAPAERQAFPRLVELPDRETVLRFYRVAEDILIQTLVGTPEQIDWKRRRLKRLSRFGDAYDIARVEAAIARDEAFLAAHPVSKKGRKGGVG